MSIVIPEDIAQSARLTAAELIQELAVALFQREKLTLGQASRLAGISQRLICTKWRKALSALIP